MVGPKNSHTRQDLCYSFATSSGKQHLDFCLLCVVPGWGKGPREREDQKHHGMAQSKKKKKKRGFWSSQSPNIS